MKEEEAVYDLALALAFRYSPSSAAELWRKGGGGKAVWDYRSDIRQLIPDAQERLIEGVDRLDEAMDRAKQEMDFASAHGIRCLSIDDMAYPALLRGCNDAPLELFYKGTADLNTPHSLSIVGTRRCTGYGKDICARFCREMAEIVPDALIVSGLAYGIDINAHRSALVSGLPTVAVLAHGLDRIYPSLHRRTAEEMEKRGGLLTEFPSGTNPDRQNFIRRNRIIAGMTQATVVVESAAKGGGLITASMASGYERNVFAFPGRISDEYSAGCNELIRSNTAAIALSAENVAGDMGWEINEKGKGKKAVRERELFPELSAEEQKVVDILRTRDEEQINAITIETGIPMARLTTLLFNMELRGIVRSLGGARYRLCI